MERVRKSTATSDHVLKLANNSWGDENPFARLNHFCEWDLSLLGKQSWVETLVPKDLLVVTSWDEQGVSCHPATSH